MALFLYESYYISVMIDMAEIIVISVVSIFFAIGIFTTVREIWGLITGNDEEKPP